MADGGMASVLPDRLQELAPSDISDRSAATGNEERNVACT
jgi:hypothetical protein